MDETTKLFGHDAELARYMRPYVEEAEREHPDFGTWSMTEKKLYRRDEIETAFLLMSKNKRTNSTPTT